MRLFSYQNERLADLILDFVTEEVGLGDLYTQEDIVAYVRANLNPEDVFRCGALHDWAFENGYRRLE